MHNNIQKINLLKERIIINILGEVCWGFDLNHFEKKIGVKREIVEILLKRLLKEEQKGVSEIYLNYLEVDIIKKALQEVEKQIEEWEFQTRLGVSLDEVKKCPFLRMC